MAQYILRLDDAAIHANWKNWNRMECLLDTYGIHPLVGVIPYCMDPAINAFEENVEFWKQLKKWIEKNWTVAMHGFDHVYISQNGGINPVNNISDFAGVPLEIQRRKIKAGVQIFRSHGIEPQVFFAPSHTMDLNTIEAIKRESKIRIISDTIAAAPYNKWGITFVPQQSGKARKLAFKIVTFCYHPNQMSDTEFAHLESFLKKEGKHFIPFPVEPCDRQRSSYDWILGKLYFSLRKVKRKGH